MGRHRLAKSSTGQPTGATDENLVVVLGETDPQHAPEALPEATRNLGGLVECIADHETACPDPAGSQGEARVEHPVRLVHGPAGSNEDVLDDEVETSARPLEVAAGITLDQLQTEFIQVEPAARGAHHLGIDLDADDLRPGREGANDSGGAPPAESQDQYRATAGLGQ